VETVLPDGCVDFIFQTGETVLHLTSGGQFVRQPLSFLIGQQKYPLLFTSPGKTVTLGIRFYAYGAYPFLGFSLKEVANQTVDLETLFGKSILELAEKVNMLPPRIAFRELELFLISKLPAVQDHALQIKPVTALLFQQKGAMDISELAYYSNLSVRTLERKFEETVGFSPKAFARIVRFDHIKDELILHPSLGLTDLAYRYGYFDQAHFIQDFKQFTGKTPSAFVESVIDRQIYFYR
jgi:AraC-like DNA-binding protein